MEEVGSFKFETNEQSVTYQVVDGSGDGRQMQGIIDEMDSDNEHSYSQKNRARNVSIVSASDDDHSVGYAREVSVDEFQKDYQFEDGYANVKIKRTVVEEEEMYVGDVDDLNDITKTSKLFEVKETVDDEIENPLPTKAQVSDISNGNAKKGGKALLCDVEEKEEHSSLSAEEAKQLRIKEIRAKARKASIVNKEDMTTNTVDDNLKTAEIIDQPKSQTKNAQLLNQDVVDEANSIDDGATHGKYENSNEKEGPQKAKQRQMCEVELDDDFENLMKRAQRQRSILNDILDKEHGISSEEEILHKSSTIDVEESGSHPGIVRSNCKGIRAVATL